MLKIKLRRVGKKKQPTYKIIILEKEKDPWGDFLEQLGYYNPFAQGQQQQVNIKKDRIKYWLSVGAQPTDTVHNILVDHGILKAKKKNVSSLGKKYKEKIKKENETKKQPQKEKTKT
jgi:small subunit ribosomal protein S16